MWGLYNFNDSTFDKYADFAKDILFCFFFNAQRENGVYMKSVFGFTFVAAHSE